MGEGSAMEDGVMLVDSAAVVGAVTSAALLVAKVPGPVSCFTAATVGEVGVLVTVLYVEAIGLAVGIVCNE
jgi:hypothetical protein